MYQSFIKIFRPFYRGWFTLYVLLLGVSWGKEKKFKSVAIVLLVFFLTVLIHSLDRVSINLDLISGIVAALGVIFLLKIWVLDERLPTKENIIDLHDTAIFSVHQEDYSAIVFLRSIGFALGVFFTVFFVTGDIVISILISASFAGRYGVNARPTSDDVELRLSLIDQGLLFDGKQYTARLLLQHVEQIKAYTAFNNVIKILLRMKDGQLHEIRFYRGMDKILSHCLLTVPASRVEWVSYT